jgi:hypothetical protein
MSKRRSGPPVPPAKKSLSEYSGTVCSRWLRYLYQKDPKFASIDDEYGVLPLLEDFARIEGYTVAGINLQFREEEERLAKQDEKKFEVARAKEAEREKKRAEREEKKKRSSPRPTMDLFPG